MTNPNNAVGTNGAYGGRTSVNAFNDVLAALSAGVVSGWACSPNTGLTVSLGGDGNTRDVAIAEDNAGNRTTINNISGSPISVTLSAAPNTNSRIDAIVAYVDNPPTGSSTVTDNYGACGLIVVKGTAAASPVAPNESAIRTAITGDGASGTTAYYVVLAYITIASGTTDITSGMIQPGAQITLNFADDSIGANKIDFTTFARHEDEASNVAITSSSTPIMQYAIPADGDYLLIVSCSLNSVASGHSTYIYTIKNSTALDSYYASFDASDWGAMTFSKVLTGLKSTDTIKINMMDTVGITASTNTKIRFSMIQLSAD